MRVLLVNDLPPGSGGGVEVHLARLIPALEAAGDVVEVFTGAPGARGPSRLLDLWNPGARRRLESLTTQFRPEVVHYHNVLRELSVSVLGVAGHVRHVLTCHDLRLLGAPDPGAPLARAPVVGRPVAALRARWERAAVRRDVDLVVGVSRTMVGALRRAGLTAVEYVPYFADGLALSAAQPVARCHDIVYAGRLAGDKGVPVLAEAFARLIDRHPEARLVVAGDGPERPRLEALADRLGRDRVILLGATDEAGVRAAMARARLVAVPSDPARRPEGSPMVAIEAAMAGRPLVVSDDPGLRELVEPAGCGLVVPAGDPLALAGGLQRLLDDPALAARMGDAAARMAREHHSAGFAVGRLRDLYAGQPVAPAGEGD
jgi:glycosyltransferase involved in cell wall biosynthesis